MSIRPDTKYNGTITEGSAIIETQRGAVGFQVQLTCEDGPTSFTIWLTEKNREKAQKSFETIGANIAKLNNAAYLEYQLPIDIVGTEVSFGTKEEEYNGKKSVKVAWIGKKSEGKPAVAAAKFFAQPKQAALNITDEDVPF